jgi:formylglycine-generating enzyme required for sulfatase activity
MRRFLILLLLPVTLGGWTKLHANLVIPTVEVGNPNNANDSTGFGGVPYVYRMATTEVTNAQYTAFLNAVDPSGLNVLGLYSGFMTSNANGGINFSSGAASGSKYSVKSGRDSNPVVFVSWYSTLRFANWMTNGQGSNSTETGAYTLLGGTPIPSNGATVTRNSGATWFLPNENEWYKAAYYDGNTGTYFDYPTSTNTVPYSDQPPGSDAPDATNVGNFFKNEGPAGYDDGYAVTGSPDGMPIMMNTQNYLTDVGAYSLADSPAGTFDQGGNVAEWTESFFDVDMLERAVRGGSWFHAHSDLHVSFRDDEIPLNGLHTIGFRLAVVPEPGALLLLALVATLSGLVHCAAKWRSK